MHDDPHGTEENPEEKTAQSLTGSQPYDRQRDSDVPGPRSEAIRPPENGIIILSLRVMGCRADVKVFIRPFVADRSCDATGVAGRLEVLQKCLLAGESMLKVLEVTAELRVEFGMGTHRTVKDVLVKEYQALTSADAICYIRA